MEKAVKNQKQTASVTSATKAPLAAAPPQKVPRLFRNIDWFAMAITFLVVWVIYFLTLAPEQTLEDSGELCTGAFYAGIPHPPGYPFWAIYSWLWTQLLPIGNVAWRVEIGESAAAALACGLVAFVVSRGSSMFMEGIEELKSLTGKWENAICIVSGIVAGLLLGLGGVMWSESVAINRISLFGVPWLMLVLVCLLRWIYAPHQWRYLYFALFAFGICATIHQTLIAAAIGIEIGIAVAHRRLGRTLFLGNGIIFVMGWIAENTGFTNMLDTAPMVKLIYNTVGIGSIVAFVWLAILTKESFRELCRDGAAFLFGVLAVLALSKGAFIGLLAVACLGIFSWLVWETRKPGLEWLVAIGLFALWVAGASFYFYEPIAGMTNPPMQWGYPRTVDGFFHALSRGQYEKANPTDIIGDPGRFLTQLGILVGDIAGEFNWVVIFVAMVPLLFFFKMQRRERSWISGLTGIYFCVGVLLIILMNPSPDRQSADLIKVFFASSHAVIAVMCGYGMALSAAYIATHYQRFRIPALMLGIVTLVPAFVTLYSGVSHTFFGVADPLPAPRLFMSFLWLTAAFIIAALAGQSLIRRPDPGNPSTGRERWFLLAYAACALICIGYFTRRVFFAPDSFALAQVWTSLPRIFSPQQYSLPVLAGLLILAISVIFIISLLLYRRRAPLLITLCLFAVMPLASGLSHWWGSEQHHHWFGYWFGHDMFTPPYQDKSGKPIYPEMTKNTILFGGTDPGRFCPTYMIFCESFIPHDCQPPMDQNFDRRDVYLITQNALADGTYLCYLRAQYFRSQQHDPPFFSELARTVLKDKDYETNLLARMVSPLDDYFMARGARIEKRWRTSTSWFSEKDFTDLPAFARNLNPAGKQDSVSQWLFQHLSKETQQLLTQGGDVKRLSKPLADDLNRLLEREVEQRKLLKAKQSEKDAVDLAIADGDASQKLVERREKLAREMADIKVEPLYEPERFAQVKISDYLAKFIAQNPQSDTRIRLNRLLLEAAYPSQIASTPGGVYPDREIYIPSNEDSQRCFQDYLNDAAVRLNHDQQFPNEQHQIKPGEVVNFEGGKVQVTGQVAVMSINGLLAKVIFDKNPDNEFYVEESFPLDWMYPHLTPFGVIMKINRQTLPELSEDDVRRDHEFWSQYAERLSGNWLTYDTPVKDIVKWIEKVYLRHDLSGFTGDRRFIRDEQAQKAFSKLRSSIGGIYAWRLGLSSAGPTPPEYQPKNEAERLRMVREADFAFRQAFVFCPYSPEAVVRYLQLLMGLHRIDDARLVVETCHKFDPENGYVNGLLNQLDDISKQEQSNPAASFAHTTAEIARMEKEFNSNKDDFQKAFDLASKYMQIHRPDRTVQILDGILDNPHANVGIVLSVVNAYSQMNNMPKVEHALEKLVQVAPNQPEGWFDLAVMKAKGNKTPEVLNAIRHLLETNAKRLAQDPKAHDLRKEIDAIPEFNYLHNMPEYQALLAPK